MRLVEELFLDSTFVPVKGIGQFYSVSSSGLIYSHRTGRILKGSTSGAGYLALRIVLEDGTQQSKYIHRIVAEAFLSNWDPKLDVNHKNGLKTDNSLSNLEMVTKSQNTQHGYDTGLLHKGANHYNTKLTIDDARAIKYGFPTLTHTQVGSIFGLKYAGASKIRQGLTWRGL